MTLMMKILKCLQDLADGLLSYYDHPVYVFWKRLAVFGWSLSYQVQEACVGTCKD